MRRTWKIRWLAAVLAGIVVALGVGLVVKRDEVVGRSWLWRADHASDGEATRLYIRALRKLGPVHPRLVEAFTVGPEDVELRLDPKVLQALGEATQFLGVEIRNTSPRTLRFAFIRAWGELPEDPRIDLVHEDRFFVHRVRPGAGLPLHLWLKRTGGAPLRLPTRGDARLDVTVQIGAAVDVDVQERLAQWGSRSLPSSTAGFQLRRTFKIGRSP